MKADNIHRAARLVSAVQSLDHSIKRLQGDDVGESVRAKLVHHLGRELASTDIPPTYIVKALQDYRDALVLEAQHYGVVFE